MVGKIQSAARVFSSVSLTLVFGSLPLSGCKGPAGGGDTRGSQTLESLYARQELRFSRAKLLKPKDSERADVYQAPLILQEVVNDEPFHAAARIGTVFRTSSGPVGLDTEKPAVYFSETSVPWRGRERRQRSYLWFYSPDRGTAPPGVPHLQGLRLTLDSAGFPAIMEILADPSGRRVIYVSRSLEAAVSREWGSALPGRRYATERGVDEQPGVVVAGVLEDSPEAMGPIVYLRVYGEVSTVVCRCMPSRVDEIQGTLEYELRPLEELEDLGIESLAARFTGQASTRSHPWPESRSLEESLRLPGGF